MESISHPRARIRMRWVHRLVRELPIESGTQSPRQVSGAIFSKVEPIPLDNPRLVAWSPRALAALGWDHMDLAQLTKWLSGTEAPPGTQPLAHCYAGHQFGAFAGQLGDGAAMLLGEVEAAEGKILEVQLKGAGKTPYSRSADGRKVLRSSLREFLCSEFMYFLGIPTTRAAMLVTSDTRIARDPVYTGNIVMERASVVTRVAESFFRFGSFEIFNDVDSRTGMRGPSFGIEHLPLMERLLDFIIKHYYAQLIPKDSVVSDPSVRLAWFEQVVRRTAKLVAQWQCVGFTHGVLNTDNLSILGLTIDYGPYGFQDYFDWNFVPNGSDEQGRYSYKNQPAVCKWNCGKLADALEPIIDRFEAEKILDRYDVWFKEEYMSIMREKLGLFDALPDDEKLVQSLFDTMDKTGCDFTRTFLSLSDLSGVLEDDAKLMSSNCCDIATYVQRFRPKIPRAQLHMILKMKQEQPLVFASFGVETIEFINTEIAKLEILQHTSEWSDAEKRDNDQKLWKQWFEAYHARLSKDCGSEDMKRRKEIMASRNPKFVLRNWIAQELIELADAGKYESVQEFVSLIENPFADLTKIPSKYVQLPPEWASKLCVTCSS